MFISDILNFFILKMLHYSYRTILNIFGAMG